MATRLAFPFPQYTPTLPAVNSTNCSTTNSCSHQVIIEVCCDVMLISQPFQQPYIAYMYLHLLLISMVTCILFNISPYLGIDVVVLLCVYIFITAIIFNDILCTTWYWHISGTS